MSKLLNISTLQIFVLFKCVICCGLSCLSEVLSHVSCGHAHTNQKYFAYQIFWFVTQMLLWRDIGTKVILHLNQVTEV